MSRQVTLAEYLELVEKKIKAEEEPLTEDAIEDLTANLPRVLETASLAIFINHEEFIDEHLNHIVFLATEFRARGLKLESIDLFLEMICDVYGDVTEDISEEDYAELAVRKKGVEHV